MATRLAQHIKDMGTTQAEFARAHGFPPPKVCQWVNGTRRPGLKHALALDEATGGAVPASYWSTITLIEPARRPKRVRRKPSKPTPDHPRARG